MLILMCYSNRAKKLLFCACVFGVLENANIREADRFAVLQTRAWRTHHGLQTDLRVSSKDPVFLLQRVWL